MSTIFTELADVSIGQVSLTRISEPRGLFHFVQASLLLLDSASRVFIYSLGPGSPFSSEKCLTLIIITI